MADSFLIKGNKVYFLPNQRYPDELVDTSKRYFYIAQDKYSKPIKVMIGCSSKEERTFETPVEFRAVGDNNTFVLHKRVFQLTPEEVEKVEALRASVSIKSGKRVRRNLEERLAYWEDVVEKRRDLLKKAEFERDLIKKKLGDNS